LDLRGILEREDRRQQEYDYRYHRVDPEPAAESSDGKCHRQQDERMVGFSSGSARRQLCCSRSWRRGDERDRSRRGRGRRGRPRDLCRAARALPAARETECLAPVDVAATVCALIEQPRSAWTFELDLRPQPMRSQ
jgi:hypothetical protein